jgi:hypothetical protein
MALDALGELAFEPAHQFIDHAHIVVSKRPVFLDPDDNLIRVYGLSNGAGPRNNRCQSSLVAITPAQMIGRGLSHILEPLKLEPDLSQAAWRPWSQRQRRKQTKLASHVRSP